MRVQLFSEGVSDGVIPTRLSSGPVLMPWREDVLLENHIVIRSAKTCCASPSRIPLQVYRLFQTLRQLTDVSLSLLPSFPARVVRH